MDFQRISSKQLIGSCRIAVVQGDKWKCFVKQMDWRSGWVAEVTLSGAPGAGLQICLWDPLSHLIRLAITSLNFFLNYWHHGDVFCPLFVVIFDWPKWVPKRKKTFSWALSGAGKQVVFWFLGYRRRNSYDKTVQKMTMISHIKWFLSLLMLGC